jgi:hypothetical protein
MHPYRDPPIVDEPPAHGYPEEMIIYGLLVVIGAIPLVLALIAQTGFGAEATLGALMACAGAIGAVVSSSRRRRRRVSSAVDRRAARAGDSRRRPR